MALGNALNIPLTPKKVEPVEPLFSDKDMEDFFNSSKPIVSTITALVVGKPKTCKTGICLDCRTPEEIKNNMKIVYIEFNHDAGGRLNKQVFHENDPNLIILDPHVLSIDETTGEQIVDYILTMAKIKAFFKWIKDNKEKLKLKAIVIDGADRFLSEICERQMKLDAGVLDAAGSVQLRFWMNRNRHWNDVMDRLLEIDVDKYIISHPKEDKETNKITYGVQKDFPDRMHEILETRYDEKTNKYFVKVIADRRNKHELLNKESCIMETSSDGKRIWHGFKL